MKMIVMISFDCCGGLKRCPPYVQVFEHLVGGAVVEGDGIPRKCSLVGRSMSLGAGCGSSCLFCLQFVLPTFCAFLKM